MHSRILGLMTSALILAYGTDGAFAQNRMTPQPDQQQMQSHPMGQEGVGAIGHGSMMGDGMMEHMMGRGMMAGGAMGPPPVMLRVMFALIDTDSDGTISLRWTTTKMANLRWRRCKRSSTGLGDRFPRQSDQQAEQLVRLRHSP
jgi:hypothetical protein